MKVPVFVAAAACLLIAGAAFAEDMPSSMTSCGICHKLDAKAMGPSYKAIAGKYKSDAEGAKKIQESIKNGSQKAWGENSIMPPQTAAANDAEAIAKWILSQAGE